MTVPGNIPLFEGVTPLEVESFLSCFDTRERRYARGETIINEGDRVESIGIVLSGAIHVVRADGAGNRTIIANFGTGAVFGESFACAGIPRSPIAVVADTDTVAIFLPFERLMRTCGKACSFHQRIITNVIRMVARKNLLLTERIEVVAKRTIREKVLAYLGRLARGGGATTGVATGAATGAAAAAGGFNGSDGAAGGRRVELPFSRGELAEFLCVDRSALSRELGKLRDEGVLSFEGRQVVLFD